MFKCRGKQKSIGKTVHLGDFLGNIYYLGEFIRVQDQALVSQKGIISNECPGEINKVRMPVQGQSAKMKWVRDRLQFIHLDLNPEPTLPAARSELHILLPTPLTRIKNSVSIIGGIERIK